MASVVSKDVPFFVIKHSNAKKINAFNYLKINPAEGEALRLTPPGGLGRGRAPLCGKPEKGVYYKKETDSIQR
jgi:hypothetical protein